MMLEQGHSPMRIRPVLAAGLLAAFIMATARMPASGDANTYVSQRRVVNVGILVSSALDMGNRGPENPDPHFFYVLDSRTDMKPAGIEYVNPLAPAVISGTIYERWRNRVVLPLNPQTRRGDPAFPPGNQTTPESQAFQVGARVTKNMGAYWEVNLDEVSSEDLSQFHLLFIHSHKPNTNFSYAQLEKLRRFVDAGGTLWVENCGGFTFAATSPFLFDVQFANGRNASAGAVVATPNHPLLTHPFILSPAEVQALGDKFVNNYYVYANRSNVADPLAPPDAAPGQNSANPPARHTLVPVVWNNLGLPPLANGLPNPGWRPYILAGQVGAGRMVFSAMDSGCGVNDYVGGYNAGYGGNSAAISGEELIGAHPRDLKFAYNLTLWAASHTTSLANVRRTSATIDRVAPALEEKWVAPGGGSANVSGAAYYKHCVFAVDGNLVLRCYDADPNRDLDGDGNPDDGVPDLIAGASRDEIWSFDLKTVSNAATGASTPTIVEIYDPTFNGAGAPGSLVSTFQRELVIVVLSDGTVVAVRALPRANQAGLPLAPVTWADWVLAPGATGAIPYSLSGQSPSGQDAPVPAAAWSEGVLFVAFNTSQGGRVAAIDPRNGSSAFHLQRPPSAVPAGTAEAMVPDQAGLPQFWGAPTVGYIRDDASGAIEKMVYVQLSSAPGRAASVGAIPFSVKGEVLVPVGNNKYRSRSRWLWFIYGNAGDDNPNLRQRVYYVAGGSTTELRYISGGASATPGQHEYSVFVENNEVRILAGSVAVPGGTFFADYTYDWAPAAGTPPQQKVNIRSALIAPDPPNPGNFLLGGPPALAANDLIYYTAGGGGGANPGTGGIFAVGEQAGGQTRVRWTYALHNGLQIPVNGNVVYIPPRLRQLDPNLPHVGQYLINLRAIGTPAVHGGVVYVTAIGNIGLKNNPNDPNEAPQTGPAVSVLMALRAEPEFVIETNQPIAQGTQLRIRQPNVFAAQNPGNPAWIELPAGTYSVDNDSGRITINSFAPRGNLAGNFVTASVPFVVQIGNQPEQLMAGTQVDAYGPGLQNREPRPVGPEGVDNLLWYVVIPETLVPPPGATKPVASPMPLGLATTSPSLQGDVLWVGFASGAAMSFDSDPGSTDPSAQNRWAQAALFTQPAAKVVGHGQWASPPAGVPALAPPAGAGNLLAINTRAGLLAYEDTLTVVADGGRLIEVNAAGEVVWACEGTRSYSVAGGDLPQFLVNPNTGEVIPSNPEAQTGTPVVQMVPFARPSLVRRIGLNDLLVVDTGNNRVMQVDRGGNVVWEVSRLQDNFKTLLRPGDPLDLNEPTDINTWTEFAANLTAWFAANGRPDLQSDSPGLIVHYLIADTGNARVIEVVDVFDMSGRPVTPTVGGSPAGFAMRRQVNFVSSTYAVQGKRYRYRTAERLVVRNSDLPSQWRYDPTNPGVPGPPIRALTVTAVSNARVPDPATPFGAVNAVGEGVEARGSSIVLLNEAGLPLASVSAVRVPVVASPNPNNEAHYRRLAISGITYATTFLEVDLSTGAPIPVPKVLFTDANGAYQAQVRFVPRTGAPAYTETVLDVEWLLPAEIYYVMTGKRLQATSIRRLNAPAGNTPTGATPALRQFLITNRFSGEDNPGVFGGAFAGRTSLFRGEVFVIRPHTFNLTAPNLGYQQDYVANGSGGLMDNPMRNIVRRIPEQVAVNDPVSGAFLGFLRYIGDQSRATSTGVLEQPAFADRPF